MPPKTSGNSTLTDLIGNDLSEKIDELYSNVKEGDEFEYIFFSRKSTNDRMGFENFRRVMEILNYKARAMKKKLEISTVLSVEYFIRKSSTTYRATISGLENINKYMEMLHKRKSHVIFSVLINAAEKDSNIALMKKTKDFENAVDIPDLGMRVKLSNEEPIPKKELEMLKKLDETNRDDISFRYKQRSSLILVEDKDATVRIDLTDAKTHSNINRINGTPSTYELELEISALKNKPGKEHLETIKKEALILLKVVQQGNFVTTKSVENKVVKAYADLLGLDVDKIVSLDARQAVSLELQHVVDKLPNRYAVTDKADGERYFLMITNDHVYLIANTLRVKDTGIDLPKTKFNGTLLDGEYIFLRKNNRHIYLAFDCLFFQNNDMRQEPSFMNRLRKCDDVVKNCFISNDQKGFTQKEYDGTFNVDKIIKYHNDQIQKFMDELNHDLEIDKRYPLIRKKYFIPVYGGQTNEIFKYSELLWKKFLYDDKTKCPYVLDGMVYHPLDQKYVTSTKESKMAEYKWKPPEKNSIDFFVMFERSADTGNILVLYDNSNDDYVKGKPYKIANLYVGKTLRGVEEPILFQEENKKYLAYLFVENGEVRDIEGNIIQDKTAVEFYYNTSPEIPDRYRWIPIRTRYDKTESIQRFGKKYGNYYEVANKVWRSIANPFLFSDITILSNDGQYDKHIAVLRGKIDHTIIMSELQENAYYQKTTNLAIPMRNFHNWIKSIIIYTHCNPTYEDGRSLKILDIGCGRGGDTMKFYYAKVDLYVGVDIDNNGLVSPVNGAISRYKQLRSTHPNFPQMFFVNADAGTILNYDEQSKILPNMTPQNKALIERFFSKDDSNKTRFDRINCQFAFHYFLPNDDVWNNFLKNLNMYLISGGYFLVTTFDADAVLAALGDKNQYTVTYTDKSGNQEVMFDVVKKFDEIPKSGIIGTGYAIDVHNAMFLQEDNYVTEYLVQKEFVIRELDEKCNMELVDTDLFSNLFVMHEEYFSKYAHFESVPQTRQFLMKVKEFYNQKDEVNKASYQLTKLNRYYIFRKRDDNKENKIKINQKKKQKQKGGNDDGFINRSAKGNKEYSFLNSIHDIAQTSKLIPETLSVDEFMTDLGIGMIRDTEMTAENIKKICSHFVIGHENSLTKVSTVIDGLNIIVQDDNGTKAYGQNNKMLVANPTIIVIKENEYKPVYRSRGEDNLEGLFKTRSKLIRDLVQNAGLVKN